MSTVNRIGPATWAPPIGKKDTTDSLGQTAIPMTESKLEKNVVRQRRRHQKIITDSVLPNRSKKDELFDHLIEVARAEDSSSDDDDDDDDVKVKKAWKNLLTNLEEYFDDETPLTSCGQWFKRRRRRKLFEQPDANLCCAIHHAVLHNNIFVVQQLVETYGCDINIRGYDHETVLHLAARAQPIWDEHNSTKTKPKIIDYLLRWTTMTDPTAIDAYDNEHRTPLHHAVMRGREDYTRWLIEAGANTYALSTLKATPLHFACFSARDDEACLRMLVILLENKSIGIATVVDNSLRHPLVSMVNSSGQTAVCLAAERGFFQSVIHLLNLSNYPAENNDVCQIELEYGVRSNNPTILRAICEKHSSYLREVSPKDDHPVPSYLLHLAAKFNNNRRVLVGTGTENSDSSISDPAMDNVSDIIRCKYDPNGCATFSPEKYTPVHVAAHYGHKAFIEYILENDNDGDKYVTKTTNDRRKMNVLHICAERGTPKTEDDEEEDSNDNKYRELCELLLSPNELKKPLNNEQRRTLLIAGDNDKNTPLHLAAKYGNVDVFLYLLNLGRKMIDPQYGLTVPRNRTDRSPLHECAKHNHRLLIEALLQLSPEINKKQLLDTTMDEDQMTCVHFACTEGISMVSFISESFALLPQEDALMVKIFNSKVGYLDMVKYLVGEHHASVNTVADKQETPLFSACEQGHESIVKYLLEKTNADPTLRTARGFNCLDIAIEKHHPEIVQRLLEHPQWRTLMASAQYDGRRRVPITPMRRLIISMPDIAYDLIDKQLTTVTGGEDQAVHLVTYDYTFFDDYYNIPDWVHGERQDNSQSRLLEWWKTTAVEYGHPGSRQTYTDDSYTLIRNHPLLLMAQSQQMRLMSLDYCKKLRTEKFRRFSLWVFTLIFLVYLLFVAIYTVIVLQLIHPQYYYNLYNSSRNTSGQIINWDYGFDADLCRQVGIYLIQSGNVEARKSDFYERATLALDVFLIVFLAKNALLILAAFPRFFRKMAYYLEGIAYILTFVFINDDKSWQTSLNFRCPIQWEVGSIGLLFCWLSLLTYMRYIPWWNIGLYVVMLEVIFLKFLKAIPVLMVLICGFGFTYYMLLQYQNVYESPFEAIFRTALSPFDLGYESRLYTPPNGVMYYPVIYFVFILTAILLAILIINLLIGLAVGEIPTLKTQAKLHRNIMLYELFSDYEVLHLQLKRIARNILSRMRHYMCGRCCCPNIGPMRLKPSAWLCEVHMRNELDGDQSPDKQMFLVKLYRWLVAAIAEDDIQSSITIEKHYKKRHRRPKEESDEDEDDDD